MPDPRQPLIRAKLSVELTRFVHNDLLGASDYLAKRIADRFAANDRAGVGFEMMAAVVMSAFAVEAILNVIGQRKVPDWNERMRSRDKAPAVYKALGLAPDYKARPYSSIERLRLIRDDLAHGKPTVLRKDWEEEGRHDDLVRRIWGMETHLENPVTPEFVAEANADVNLLWDELLATSGISAIETMSGGSSGVEFLGYATDADQNGAPATEV